MMYHYVHLFFYLRKHGLIRHCDAFKHMMGCIMHRGCSSDEINVGEAA
jgi:hypothetical protein